MEDKNMKLASIPLTVISEYYWLEKETVLTGKSADAVQARRIYIYILCVFSKMSIDEIAEAVGMKRRSVLTALRWIEKQNSDKKLMDDLTQIQRRVRYATYDYCARNQSPVDTIANRIMTIACNRARKSAAGPGRIAWLCGAYTSRIGERVKNKIKNNFSEDEVNFIIDHLSDECDDEMDFSLYDACDMERCNLLNIRLNALVPQLHANIFIHNN